MATSVGTSSPDGYKLIAHAAVPEWEDYNPKREQFDAPEPKVLVNSGSYFRLIKSDGTCIETTADEYSDNVAPHLPEIIGVWVQ